MKLLRHLLFRLSMFTLGFATVLAFFALAHYHLLEFALGVATVLAFFAILRHVK